MDTGTLNLAQYGLEQGPVLPPTSHPFPPSPLTTVHHRPSRFFACFLHVFLLDRRHTRVVLDSPTPSTVTWPHSLTTCINPNSAPPSPPSHTYTHIRLITVPHLPSTQEGAERGIFPPSRFRWSHHSFTQLSFISLAPSCFLPTAAALYLNEQSILIIVARQGFF